MLPYSYLRSFSLTLAFLISFLFIFSTAKAVHNYGGEMSWECIKSGPDQGKFVFTVIIYRNCEFGNAIPIPMIKHPFGPDIPTTHIASEDLTPQCFDSAKSLDCYFMTRRGYAEKRIYKSAPTALVGIPSVNGSVFYVTSSSLASSNNTNTGFNYLIRSIMYPSYDQGLPLSIGTSGNPSCYDSSPVFAETPVGTREGVLTNLSYYAHDEELDEVTYDYAQSWSAFNVPFTNYQSGYSYSNPLLQTPFVADSNRLNAKTGIIQFDPKFGVFRVIIEATARKCGVPTAKIYRDYFYNVSSGSYHNSYSAVTNEPPNVLLGKTSAPGNGVNTYYDTVAVGDTVKFNIEALDSQLVDTNRLQMMALSVYSSVFEGGTFDPVIGNCITNNCIEIDTSVSSWNGITWEDSVELNTDFSWVADCSALATDSCTLFGPRTFQFLFKVTDDFCAIPAVSYATAFITVVPAIDTTSNTVRVDSLSLTSTNNFKLDWQTYTGTGFSKYYIIRSEKNTFNTILLDSVSSISTTSYLDTTADPRVTYNYSVALNKADLPPCSGNEVVSNFKLIATNLNDGFIQLDWEEPVLLQQDTDSVYYQINYQDTSGNLVTIDSITGTNYTDSIDNCEEFRGYQIKAYRSNQYITFSNHDTVYLNAPPFIDLKIHSVDVDTSGSVQLSWTSKTSLTNLKAYELYVFHATDSTGPYNPLDTLLNHSTVTYKHDSAHALTQENYYYVQVKAFSECTKDTSLSPQSNTVGTGSLSIANPNNGYLNLSWTPFHSKNNKTGADIYKIYKKFGTGGYALIDSTAYGNENLTDTVSICNTNIFYRVESDSAGVTIIYTNYINVTGYEVALVNQGDSLFIGPIGTSYTWYRNDTAIGNNTNELRPDRPGDYRMETTLDNGCFVTTNTVNLDVVPGINDFASNHDIRIQPNPTTGSFYLRLSMQTGDRLSYELLSVTGSSLYPLQHIQAEQNGVYQRQIDVSQTPKGLYFLKIMVNERSYVKKIIFK